MSARGLVSAAVLSTALWGLIVAAVLVATR